MLRKFTKLISVFMFSVFFLCFGYGQNYYTINSDFPQAQFKSTSTMPTSYSVPQLNSYGRAEYPISDYYPSSLPIRKAPPSCNCDEGCTCGCQNPQTGGVCECTPVGDIDIVIILLMLSLWFIYKSNHKINKTQKYKYKIP